VGEETYRLGIDTGGTFTDFVLIRESDGEITSLKTLSTPPEFSQGVVNGLDKLDLDLRQVNYIVHGTTIGVNALIQRQGAMTGLLTTRGFEDILHIQWMNKPEMYSLFYRKPAPLVRRRNRLGIDERVDGQGRILKEVDPERVHEAMRSLIDRGITSLAICTINSYANPKNEQRIFQIVQEAYPNIHVSVSNHIISQRREYERTSTTVLNAYIAPLMCRYLEQLENELERRGFKGTFLVMKSNGGVMTVENAKVMPVHTLLSGPVGGTIALTALGNRLGFGPLIGFDMGGTSTDVSVVVDSKPQMSSKVLVEGYPVMTPVVDINSIGAGGGSIATIEGLTSLRVGPLSAGANPGPACYDMGGTRPTVTDANLVLRRLDANIPLADGIFLKQSVARAAVKEQIAKRLNFETESAGLAITRIANVKMAYAIRGLTIEKGLDPREFSLVAFGGAGPLHAAFIASQLGIPRVIIPRAPGNFSAWGMLNTDLRHDLVKTIDLNGDEDSLAELRELFAEMERQGRQIMANQKTKKNHITIIRSVDVRYKGQEHALTVQIKKGETDVTVLENVISDFHKFQDRYYGHSSSGDPVEFVAIRLELRGELQKPEYYEVNRDLSEVEGLDESKRAKASDSLQALSAPKAKYRDVVFESGICRTKFFQRSDLFPGHTFKGPAIINEPGCTVLLPPSCTINVDELGNLIMDVSAEESGE
jgi:N-methylhydantoinase A